MLPRTPLMTGSTNSNQADQRSSFEMDPACEIQLSPTSCGSVLKDI